MNFELLRSFINEDRIIRDIQSLKISSKNYEVKEIATKLVLVLTKVKHCKNPALKHRSMQELVRVHQVLKQHMAKNPYERDVHDLLKSLSLIYVVYFLTMEGGY